jgi:mono/diheme cytochrome c family protein
MRMPGMPRLRTVAGWVGAAIAGVALAGFLFAWSGAYNIAASRGHWAVVEWMLEFGMTKSVQRRAWAITVPPLDDPDMLPLGAAHFHRACSHCHGAPGIPGDLTAKHALPPPPDLTNISRERKDNELFWIVKHGIKYTGMPSWVALERDDEIWPVIAFLKKLPGMSRDEYRRLAIGPIETPAQSGRDIALMGVTADALGACARCHGRFFMASLGNFSLPRCKRMRPAGGSAASCSRSRSNSRRIPSISWPRIIPRWRPRCDR